MISRDGVPIYASAAKESHPEVIQVSDRFHIIKDLTEAVTRYLIREFPARIEIPAVSVNTDEIRRLQNINNRSERVAFAHQKHKEGLTVNEIALLLHSTTKTVQKYLKLEPSEIVDRIIVKEKNHLLALQQKQQEADYARELAKKGIPIEQIAKEMHHTYKTIQNYLSPEYSIEDRHYNMRIPGKLSPYESEVIKLRSEGMTYPAIHKIITEKGYDGSVASLIMFMQKVKIRNQAAISQVDVCSDYLPKEYVQGKSLTQLVYKDLDNVKTINKMQYEQVLKSYPIVVNLYVAVKELYAIIYSKHSYELEPWLAKIKRFNIPELQTYINGIRCDIDAVKKGH